MKPFSRRRKWAIAIAAAACVLAVLAWVPMWAVRAMAMAFPGTVWLAETQQPAVAITFDDGPDPVYTPQVLEILAQHNARATFFLIGAHARKYPELVARIRAEGHEIGNHTDTRGTTLLMSAARFEESLLRTERTLNLGEGRKFLRPAGGLIRPAQVRAAQQRGYTVVVASAYAWDGRLPPPAWYIRWVIGKNLRPGVIVVLHDSEGNRAPSIGALDGILEAGKSKGLKWVTLSEVLVAKR